MTDALDAGLILAAFRAIVREELAAALHPPRRALMPADRVWLALLLPAIDAAAGDAVLTTAELAALALRPQNAALAVALSRRLSSMRSLGKALSRCADRVVGDFELRHVGNASGAALWQCVKVSNSRQTPETVAADSAPPRRAA